MATKKQMLDSIMNLATRFKITDETRLNFVWLSYKIDQVRAGMIVEEYAQTGIIDHSWLSAPMLVQFHRTNYADNMTIPEDCVVSKATIPQTVSLKSNEGGNDLGIFSLTPANGRKQYYFKRIFQWATYCPPEHTNALFKYYDRINTNIFVNSGAEQLLLTPILLNPEDGVLNNTTPIASGSIVNGTSYLVKYAQIVYNGNVIAPNTSFTGTATNTFTGNGAVYLTSQVEAITDTAPYPASGEMMRNIELEILAKEFQIEKGALVDVRNDSTDDANKVQSV